MKNIDFVHLHVHSAYSLLDGVRKPDIIVAEAARSGMKSIALTDHGVTYGFVEFVQAAKEHNIKPILGVETYHAPRTRFDKEAKIDTEPYHLVLLVKDNEGFKNLNKIVTKSFTEGFYYRPRVDFDLLQEHSKGLIASSACLVGAVSRFLLAGDEKRAMEYAGMYNEIFGKGNFYLEIMDHGLPEQSKVNAMIIDLASKLDIPIIATNDVHYIKPSDAFIQDVLISIATGKKVEDKDRLKYDTDQMYLKTPFEMYKIFGEIPEALYNTLEIAEKINFEMELGKNRMPKYPVPPEFSSEEEYLKYLAYKGLKNRYPNPSQQVMERLEKELSVIEKTGFAGYFLIVQDYINWAKSNGIPVGPGRGSAAGSLVAYLLGITDVDPLKYGLLFERFLNPERISMPDIDVDFCARRRDEVLQYARQRYGEENVSQIATFGTLASRAAVRDVGRVLGIPLQLIDKLAKSIPQNTSLADAESLDDVVALEEKHPELKKVLDIAKQVEGLPRHASTHAAGVVISDKPLYEYVALQLSSEDAAINVTTQLEKDDVEKLGLLKMDFLGLKNMTIIHDTLEFIKKRHNKEINLQDIPMDDPSVYEMIANGDTIGVFQLEGYGFRSFLRSLKPTRFEEIIAAEALYRPGTIGSGGIKSYIERKFGREEIDYFHPDLKPILEETYGIMVYQEQIMQVASVIAGYSLGEADVLRRAIGKKIVEEIQKLKDDFIRRGVARGYNEDLVRKIYDTIVYFAEYGFNKSHSAAYAHISYYTAWLKKYYPTEYFAALMASFSDNTDKLKVYIKEAQLKGIKILPPDINKSEETFIPEGKKSIRFGLSGIKNVGKSAVDNILATRKDGPFESLEDFLSRVNTRIINKKVLESLIRAGVLASFGSKEDLLRIIKDGKQKEQKTISLYSSEDNYQEKIDSSILDEKEYLGFYISYHPVSVYKKLAKLKGLDTLEDIQQMIEKIRAGEKTSFRICVEISDFEVKRSGKDTFVVMTVEDETDENRIYVRAPEFIDKIMNMKNCIAVLDVNAKISANDENKIYLSLEGINESIHIKSLDEKYKEVMKNFVFKVIVNKHMITQETLNKLNEIISSNPGNNEFEIIVLDKKNKVIKLPYTIDVNDEVRSQISEILRPVRMYMEKPKNNNLSEELGGV